MKTSLDNESKTHGRTNSQISEDLKRSPASRGSKKAGYEGEPEHGACLEQGHTHI